MPGIGFTEILLLAGIALVIIGPEKFPDFAKVVVRTMRDIRGYMDEVKNELSEELRPVEKEMREITKEDPRKFARDLTSSSRKSPWKDTTGEGEEPADADEDPYPPEETPTSYGGYDDGPDNDQEEYWGKQEPNEDVPGTGATDATPREEPPPEQNDTASDFEGEGDFDPPHRLDG